MLPLLVPKFHRSIRSSLILGLLLVLTPISIVFGLWGVENQRAVLLETIDRHSRSLAHATAITCVEPLLASDFPVLDSTVESLTRSEDGVVFVMIEDATGRIVAPTGATKFQNLDPKTTKIHTAPIVFEDGAESEQIGRIILGLSTSWALAASADSQRMQIIETISLFLALGTALWWLLYSLIDKPLRSLDQDAQRLAQADFSKPIELQSEGEFRRLAAALEQMRSGLQISYEEIRQQNHRLLALDRMKSEFLATMSHEIRTPMNGVIGFGHELLDTDLDPQQRDMLQTVVSSAEELLVLLNDILDFSRLEASRLQLEAVPTDLRRLVEDVARLIEPEARKKGIEIHVICDKMVPVAVLSDRHRIRQVLGNLLNNAVKFTNHGSVTLGLRTAATAEHPDRLRFEVIDTGIGVPEDKIDLLFEPFRQVDGSHARKFGGSGLGLSICSRLIELMGSRIEVDSEVGSGTAFCFELDLPPTDEKPKRTSWTNPPRIGAYATDRGASEGRAEPEGPVAVEPGAAPGPGGNGLRVLLAEDNLTNQKLFKHVLARLGNDVTVADDGNQVVAAYEADPDGWDLILMDCQMPEMDGFEATAAIRKREGDGRHTPIVALTANAMVGDRERCLAAGMDDYLSKPLLTEELRAVLARWSPSRAR